MKQSGIILLIFSFFIILSCSDDKKETSQKTLKGHYKAIDTITSVLLETVSGEAAQARNWKRFKNLFKPYAQLTAISHRQNSVHSTNFSLDEFIELADRNSRENSFVEVEMNENIEIFGNIAHVFQVYVSKSGKDKSSHRGINSYQLVFDQGRWWIVSVTWDIETPENRIPSKFLGTDKREVLPS